MNASEQSSTRINLDDDSKRVLPPAEVGAAAAGPSPSVSSKVVATWSTELSMSSLSDWVRPLILRISGRNVWRFFF